MITSSLAHLGVVIDNTVCPAIATGISWRSPKTWLAHVAVRTCVLYNALYTLSQMTLTARAYLRSLGQSAMQPIVFRCMSDDAPQRPGEWVLKLMGKNRPELIGDWVGCLLAAHLRLPTPEVDIADVDQEAIETCPRGITSWARPGPAFASRYVGDSQDVPNDRAVVNLCSGEFLGGLYAMDTWLEVLDRKKPEGNWNLIRRNAEGDSQAYAIDFGKCMAECLFPPLLDPNTIATPSYPIVVRQAAFTSAAISKAKEIADLSATVIDEVVASIPAVWIDDESGRECIREFLRRRQLKIVDACGDLKAGIP